MKKLILGICIILQTSFTFAAPSKNLWPKWKSHNSESTNSIDHSLWDNFLAKYTLSSGGVNLVKYGKVSAEDRRKLQKYLSELQSTKITNYNRNEQRAYWINLYNAETVEVILAAYPVKTIRDTGESGLFSSGPWDLKLLTVEGEKLSLNDIEHRILRPIWNDERIHYAVNCASYSCPNLAMKAYTSKNAEILLDQGARDYINHPRGIQFDDEDIIASSIYDWYAVDFGDNEKRLIRHWLKYANPSLKSKLRNFDEDIDYEYNWSLNESK